MKLPYEDVCPIIRRLSHIFARRFPRYEADELFNIAFVGKVQNVDDIKHVSTAVRQTLIDFLRKERRLREHLIENGESPDECVNSDEQKIILDELMSRADLSPKEGEIIYLLFYRNMKQQEIAKKLNVSCSTVSRTIRITMEKLRRVYDDQNK
jgi:RNA polymerase sigma factor (sigma-70 family)